jgi:hypothetical protein
VVVKYIDHGVNIRWPDAANVRVIM